MKKMPESREKLLEVCMLANKELEELYQAEYGRCELWQKAAKKAQKDARVWQIRLVAVVAGLIIGFIGLALIYG